MFSPKLFLKPFSVFVVVVILLWLNVLNTDSLVFDVPLCKVMKIRVLLKSVLRGTGSGSYQVLTTAVREQSSVKPGLLIPPFIKFMQFLFSTRFST